MDYRELHQPVLLKSTLAALNPQPNESYLDLTAGAGSHADAVINAAKNISATLVDRDSSAIDILNGRFDDGNVDIVNSKMSAYVQSVAERKASYDMVLADLGLSSMQLDSARGFSFNDDSSSLDMSMGQSEIDALDVVNQYSRSRLADVLTKYADIHGSEKLADSIISARPLNTVENLVECISRSYRGNREGRPRFMSRVFQAIRIEVNDELGELRSLLDSADSIVAAGGRLAIISFHSLEDRMVKDAFNLWTKDKVFGRWSICESTPAMGSDTDTNPRARSAILRAVVKK